MKILLCTFWEVPHIGGVWNYMNQLKTSLERYGHTVDLLGYGKNHETVVIDNLNIKINKADVLPFKGKSYKASISDPVISYYENLMNFFSGALMKLNLHQYDLIHAQDVISSRCLLPFAAAGKILVSTLHGCVAQEIKEACYLDESEKSIAGRHYFDKLEYEGATAGKITITANEWLKNLLVSEYHVPAAQIEVNHYGYNISSFLTRMEESTKAVKPLGKKVLLYTGRLAEFKGVHYLIESLSLLKKERTDWVCWIAGDGPKKTELEMQAVQYGIQHDITFLGSRNDIPSLLAISDILVLPTLFENQPLSVIEAQISGTAVIASKVGGVPEIIAHGKTGVLVPPKDTVSLAKNIEYLLEHDSYRMNLGKNAQNWALEHWSMERSVEKLLQFYEQALK